MTQIEARGVVHLFVRLKSKNIKLQALRPLREVISQFSALACFSYVVLVLQESSVEHVYKMTKPNTFLVFLHIKFS